MKVRYYSDLHLDHYSHKFDSSRDDCFWYPPELPDDKDTILIIAGDLWTGTKFIEFASYSWITKVALRFKRILIVLGNHDFWPCNDKLTIMNGAVKCNNLLRDMGIMNVDVMDCNTIAIDDYLFVGATLWTDMFKCNPLAMYNMKSYMRYDGKIIIDAGEWGIDRLTSQRWVDLHYKHRDYIKLTCEQNKDKKIFVITHHLPLTTLGDPNYNNDPGNAYYYSDLSDIILDNPQITHWVSGHTHHSYDVKFEGCRMLNNSVGYASEYKEQKLLVKHEIMEI